MAAEAERLRRRGGQLDPGDVVVDPDFVAAQAAGRDRRVNCFPFGLVFVALQALRGVDVLIQRNRMRLCKAGSAAMRQQRKSAARIRRVGESFRAVRLVTSGTMPLRLLHDRVLIWHDLLWRIRNL